MAPFAEAPDPRGKGRRGRTAAQVAREGGHEGTARDIEEGMADRNRREAKMCFERMKRRGVYEAAVKGRNANDLERHVFAFKVVEMMKCCEMQSQAEEILKWVGRV